MKNLYESLITESYNIVYDNPEDALNFINTNLKNAKKVNQDNLEAFVNKVYDVWINKLNGQEILTPFRFSKTNQDVKISKAYAVYMNEFTSIPSVTQKDYKTGDTGIQIDNKLVFKFGEGTAFRVGGSTGIAYESTIVDEICTFCTTVANSGEDNLTEADLNKMFDKSFENIFNMYLSGVFDNLIQYAKENLNTDLHEFVVSTGTQNILRNSHDEIFNIDFNITSGGSNIQKTLTDSGKIISDITLRNPFDPSEELYVSVKMKAAQLSGVSYGPAFYSKKSQIPYKNSPADCITRGVAWEEIPDKNMFKGFNNFFETFGINPKEIYDQYVSNDFKNIKITGRYNKKEISSLIQMLLGGNYWYVNPKYSIWVPDVEAPLNVNLTDVDITNKKGQLGKTININGTINNQKMQIVFRTSSKIIKFPYRLFAKLNVKQLMQDFEKKGK